jgi:DNA repair photolyase
MIGLVRTWEVDTVCPNFFVLAHAIGCAFNPQCSYCYLRDKSQYPPGTLTHADMDQMKTEIRQWIAQDDLATYVLNSGNLSDSLVFERGRPVMAELVELFRTDAQAKGRPHTLLLVTKGGMRECQTLLAVPPCPNVIVSFSVNCAAAAAKYEAGAAGPDDRLAAARAMQEKGWHVRIRIDPMIQGHDYAELIAKVRGLAPRRVTLGTLRADGRLVEFAGKDTMAGLLPPSRPDGIWQYPRPVRMALYRPAVEALRGVCSVGLCEEWPDLWDELGLDRQARACNCNHI